jgi:hypothetical protein
MLQVQDRGWRGSDRARRFAIVFALAAFAFAGPAVTESNAIFRAFSNDSPWNETVVPVAPVNPYAGQFADIPGFTMKISGTPDNITYGSPVFFAQKGDPTATVHITQPDWRPQKEIRWNGKPIPVPAGVSPAPGADGHLTVVSADRRISWEFLGCTQATASGYVAKVVAQWDLTGPGYTTADNNTSARGSGTPLISTSLRADEALGGIRHALGITVPRVSNDYIYPAAHSDGKQGLDAIKYGMRFVLRPDFLVPPRATIGVQNVIYTLKIYGAYVVDQGADFVLDADYTHPEVWQQAGVGWKSFGFTGADFLPARPGIPPPLPVPTPAPVQESQQLRPILLHADSRSIQVGDGFHVRGRVRRHLTRGLRVRVEVRTRTGWRLLRSRPVGTAGEFGTWARLERVGHASRKGRFRALRLRDLRFGPGVRELALRALAPGVGRSNIVRVRVRR